VPSERLEKYHGLGNDFLVLVDLDGRRPVDAAWARAVCDRHLGVGADGLVRVVARPEEPRYVMELFNADGGRAEMSGNGIRCLARALADLGVEDRVQFDIATEGGVRTVTLADDGSVRVDMGVARLLPAPRPGADDRRDRRDRREAAVDMGNPHVVVEVADPAPLDLDAEAERWGGDTNVEVVAAGPGADELTMRVFERGVGETQACGTGACAAAFVARSWSLVGDRVVVHQPGGSLSVDLSGTSVVLAGPATRVASVELAEELVPAWR